MSIRPHAVVWLGLAAVLLAAAILSFEALRNLALAVGISSGWAWLLPIAVDAGAAASCSVWLGGRSTEDAARFAGRMTWALLGTTVAGNATQLGMASVRMVPPWWVTVIVGAIPPAVVGATVHLVVLLIRGSGTPPVSETTTPADDSATPTQEPKPKPEREAPPARQPEATRAPVVRLVKTPQARKRPTDAEAIAQGRRWIADNRRLPRSRREWQAATGVTGSGRAERLAAQLSGEHAERSQA